MRTLSHPLHSGSLFPLFWLPLLPCCAPPPCLLCPPLSPLVWLPRSVCLCCSSPCLLALLGAPVAHPLLSHPPALPYAGFASLYDVDCPMCGWLVTPCGHPRGGHLLARGAQFPPPRPGGNLGYCTCAQKATSTKSAGRKWLVSGLEDHGHLSVTKNATPRQPVGRTPTSWQQPCSGTQWVALAKQGLLDLPYNAMEFTQGEKLMEMLSPPPPPLRTCSSAAPVMAGGVFVVLWPLYRQLDPCRVLSGGPSRGSGVGGGSFRGSLSGGLSGAKVGLRLLVWGVGMWGYGGEVCVCVCV